jgi:uncharacterized protein (TIGR00299 family) protein
MADSRTLDRMRLIHLDAVGGVAGDMFVAAMLDAFPALRDRVLSDARAVLPTEAGQAELVEGFSRGVRALRFGLAMTRQPPAPSSHDQDRHYHAHDDHHDHSHGHEAAAQAPHGTRYIGLKQRIEAASLAEGTAAAAVGILSALAQAEANIHGVPVDEVHFHEVGDWDSLMDVVAAGSIASALHPARWTVSDLPRGRGLVRTQHGLLPVPAPATAEMLTGFRWRDDGVSGERVTPTGAAIIRYLCGPQDDGAGLSGRLVAVGSGAGTRDLGAMPNILRVTVFESEGDIRNELIEVVTFDVDDMTGEEIAVAADRLRQTPGVVDLTLQPVSGKKGRPATRFQLLVSPGDAQTIAVAIFEETSTLGLRRRSEARMILPREETVRSGRRAKIALRPSGGRTVKLESEEIAGVAGLADRRAIARGVEGVEDD